MRASRLLERHGPWALVTGATDGMGRALAERLAAAGFHLVVVARRRAELQALADGLSARCGVTVVPMALDLSHAPHVAQLLADTRDFDIGLVVAAAGYGTAGPLVDSDLSAEIDMLQVNCRAVLAICHAFAGRLAERGRGGLVLFGSLVGWQGVPRAAHYAATKAYVQSLAEGLRVELAPHGVDVLSAAPGPVASGFAARAGMRMGLATPATVAADGIFRRLGTRGTVVPGLLGKCLTASLAPLPRPLRVRIMARVMRGMTRHLPAPSAGIHASGTPPTP